MKADAQKAGIHFVLHEKCIGFDGHSLRTDRGALSAGYYINAAGLYADRVARMFGFSKNFAILPFKGLYLCSNEAPGAFRTNIYPVPDLRNPFLGVHVTTTVDGRAKIGPTAIPAFWREQYGGLQGFNLSELFQIVGRGLRLWQHSSFDFRALAREEFAKYRRRHLVELSKALAEGIRHENYMTWGRPGSRAQ